jgi:hypothetical protein
MDGTHRERMNLPNIPDRNATSGDPTGLAPWLILDVQTDRPLIIK